mgnify:CR=1 FL=1
MTNEEKKRFYISDYEGVGDRYEKILFSDKLISDANKACVKEFLVQYRNRVRDPTRANFLRTIRQVLLLTENIRDDIRNKKKINEMYSILRGKMRMFDYTVACSSGRTLATWINSTYNDVDELPCGFKDISRKGINTSRNLSPNDMIVWEDILELCKATPSIQLKALLQVQLDAGMRSSELLGLNVGDVKVHADLAVIHISESKTHRPRDIIIHRSLPALQGWLYQHPHPDAENPLWITESPWMKRARKKSVPVINTSTGPISRMHYESWRHHMKMLVKKTGFKKKISIYILRHSSCTQAKKDNLPVELACKKYGHSATHFLNTYGRLSLDDSLDRTREALGLETKKTDVKKPKNILCTRCDTNNQSDREFCQKCGSPLTIMSAMKMEEDAKNKIETTIRAEMKSQMDKLQEEILFKIRDGQLKNKE